uniref:Reverse transcriptase domain-containing protein n=1 Tax=Tanacetum cinerariifolium TaxID=118510 RepID=A0A6L2JLM4_TANCI|nr:reverse transcriptase domain-containing protein [Tanacetum cinerariifolium]
MLFGKREKLSLRYVGLFKILARVGPVVYTLELPEELKGIYSTFHVSNLKKCLAKGDIVVPIVEIQLDDKLHEIKEPVEIIDREWILKKMMSLVEIDCLRVFDDDDQFELYNELTLIEDYDDNHVYNEDTYGATYIDPDCYYDEVDAIKKVQVQYKIYCNSQKTLKLRFKALEMCDKARRRFQFYPYDKEIRYLVEQISGDIEELEKKKKKNDVM